MPSKLLVARRGGGNQYPLVAPPGGAGAQAGPGPTYPSIAGFINVKNAPYNAAGNGSTDDTTAIQNALNAAASAAPYGVYFPAGTYMISAALVYTNNHKLVGADPTTTTIRNLTSRAASNTMMLTRSGHGVTNVVIHSLNFDQRSDFYDGPLNRQHSSSPNLDFTGTVNLLCENVHVHNSRTIAFYCDNANSLPATTGLTIQYCHLFQANGGGISVFGKMSDIDIHYNTLEHTNDDAIALQDKADGSYPDDIRITNNTILNCDLQSVGPETNGYIAGSTPRGILAFGSNNQLIDHNTIVNTFRSNIESTIGGGRRATNITISNNVCTGAGVPNNPGSPTPCSGIFLLQSDNIFGDNNVITGSVGTSYRVESCTGVAGTLP